MKSIFFAAMLVVAVSLGMAGGARAQTPLTGITGPTSSCTTTPLPFGADEIPVLIEA